MCSPTLLLVGAGTLSASAQYQAGAFAQDIGEFNQAALNRQAESTLETGKIAEQNKRFETAALKGKQKTGFAKSGVDIGVGSPVDILSDTAAIGELDALTIRQGSETEAYNLRVQGVNARLQGDLAKRQGTAGALGTILTTSATIAAL